MPFTTRSFCVSAARVALVASVVLGAWLILVGSVRAQTAPVRYLAVDGVDAGDCSDPTVPCGTLDYAVQQADDGDEVRLAEGVYPDPAPAVPVLIDGNGLTIVGEGDVAVLDNLLILNSNAITVSGIDFVGGTIVAAYSTNVILDDISVTSPPPGAIGVWGIASEVAVLNSAFSGDFAEAVRLQADVGGELDYTGSGFEAVVQNVTVTGGEVGIQVAAMSAATVDNVTVTGAETAIEVGSLFVGEAATVGVPAAPFSAHITNSYFEGSTTAMTLYGHAPGGLNIRSNQIIGTVHFWADTPSAISFDLEENWWGTDAGPDPGANPGRFTSDGDSTMGVNFTPWCGDPACTTLLRPVPPPVDPTPPAPPPTDPEDLPTMPRYYEVPDVVSVLIEAGDGETEQLPARPKEEWLEEGRRLLPNLRDEDWFTDIVITVVSEAGEDPGALRIELPEGVGLDELGR